MIQGSLWSQVAHRTLAGLWSLEPHRSFQQVLELWGVYRGSNLLTQGPAMSALELIGWDGRPGEVDPQGLSICTDDGRGCTECLRLLPEGRVGSTMGSPRATEGTVGRPQRAGWMPGECGAERLVLESGAWGTAGLVGGRAEGQDHAAPGRSSLLLHTWELAGAGHEGCPPETVGWLKALGLAGHSCEQGDLLTQTPHRRLSWCLRRAAMTAKRQVFILSPKVKRQNYLQEQPSIRCQV